MVAPEASAAQISFARAIVINPSPTSTEMVSVALPSLQVNVTEIVAVPCAKAV